MIRVACLCTVGLAVAGAGCSSVKLAENSVKAVEGPASTQSIARIVAVTASCGSLGSLKRKETSPTTAITDDATNDSSKSIASACTAQQIDGVDQLVRSGLEFHGYSVIDSERLNATTMSRREILTRETVEGDGDTHSSSSRDATTHGAQFADAPPTIQDEILAELGAEGLLSTRIIVGAMMARSPRRHIDVQVRLLHVGTGDLVWASRCRVEAGWTVDEEPIMEAARCAVDAITGVKR